MPRYKLIIEYDGTPYIGWQIQQDGQSIQGRLREAIKAFCNQDIIPSGAGRTDAGVHALGQAAHIVLEKDWPADIVRNALNQHLKPDPIVITDCNAVGEEFDARFSALKRHYLYRIVNRPARLALDEARAWHVPQMLNAEIMQQAAQDFLGQHDFTAFRSSQCQAKSPVKTLDLFEVQQQGEEILLFCSARSFMHNQVRSMVGTLKRIGEGKMASDAVAKALEAKDRSLCGPVAPAHGLYLARVDYPSIEG